LTPSCDNAPPTTLLGAKTGAFNLSLFPDTTDIALGTGYPGALFFHLADLLAAGCTASGFLVDQGSVTSNNVITNDAGTLSVAITPDGRYAFVDNEYGIAPGSVLNGNIGVVAIQRDASGNFISGTTLIGQIPTGGIAIAGMLLSHDSNRLYVTSELTGAGIIPAATGNPILFHGNCTQTNTANPSYTGILSVIDVASAEVTPDNTSIMSTVAAGCSPTRMVETADDKTLWLSARGDNRVLAFDTSLLESNPDVSLVGYTNSGGNAPVGLGLFDKDHYLAVANSDRFSTPLVDGNVAILDVSDPTRASVIETTPAGLFPREIDVGPDDSTLYLTNFASKTLQVITTSITQ
jgi:DNA-binding beta-propeller fold protein YncE